MLRPRAAAPQPSSAVAASLPALATPKDDNDDPNHNPRKRSATSPSSKNHPSVLRALLLPPLSSSPRPRQLRRPRSPPPAPPSPSPDLAAALLSLILKRRRASLFGASLAMLYACDRLPFGGSQEEEEDEEGEGEGEDVPKRALDTLDGKVDATLSAVLSLLARGGVTAEDLVDDLEEDGGDALAALWVVEAQASSRRSHATRASFWYACAQTLLLLPPPGGVSPDPPSASAWRRRRAQTERQAARLKPCLVRRQRALLEACGWRVAIGLSWSRDVAPSLQALQRVRCESGGDESGEDDATPLEAARRVVREEAEVFTRAHARMKAEEEAEKKAEEEEDEDEEEASPSSSSSSSEAS